VVTEHSHINQASNKIYREVNIDEKK